MSDIIAVVDDEKCNPDRCDHECIRFDPLNRSPSGPEGFHIDPEVGKARVNEAVVMEGHRISANKCPFDAIKLVNLEKETGEKLHQYGENQFRLYGLPAPKENEVVGVLGRNGTGKSTALQILAGKLKPNLGRYDEDVPWSEVVKAHRGTELQTYFERLADDEIDPSFKVQRVDDVKNSFSGKVGELLSALDERGNVERLVESLDMEEIENKNVGDLSGGEMQRVAVAGCLCRDADVYLIDEPSSFLDVKQRLNVARNIRRETMDAEDDRRAVVVEHDLATLDLIADYVHVAHGDPGAYGMISNSMSSRNGINQYLQGYLQSHNLRIRSESLTFHRGSGEGAKGDVALEYPDMEKTYPGFDLDVEAGEFHEGEVLGVVGENGIGKTTFAKMLAGETEPDGGPFDAPTRIAYKPQHLSGGKGMVRYVLARDIDIENKEFKTRVEQPLGLEELYEREMPDLSGGELQKVGIAACLGRDADVFLLDEPSAYLDVETRINLANNLRKFARDTEKPVVVIDHDLVFLDYISDRVLVFEGEAGVDGQARQPELVSEGFNRFLGKLDITFRKDPDTGRPRSNKPGSQKDRKQRNANEFYEN
ncbi:MAG: ribosome biogenesis/translation initiation ATPase RLI [Halobacteria archaeon]